MGGDLDLSITMTMLSCVLALGLTPAWLQVVPHMVDSEDEISIPFAEIGTTLAAVIVPAFIGSFINWLGQVQNRKRIFTSFFRNINSRKLCGSQTFFSPPLPRLLLLRL